MTEILTNVVRITRGAERLDVGRGLRNDIGNVCEYPKAEVINNLLAAWQRSR